MDDTAWSWLQPALQRGIDAHLTREQIEAGITKGELCLWRGETAAFVTYLIEKPRGPTLHVWLAGGLMGGLLAMRPGIEAWGRAYGARFASIKGRPGWERTLKPFGFVREEEELIKPL